MSKKKMAGVVLLVISAVAGIAFVIVAFGWEGMAGVGVALIFLACLIVGAKLSM
jgi:hypothetical protein